MCSAYYFIYKNNAMYKHLLLLLLLIACNSKPQKETAVKEAVSAVSNLQGCYLSASDMDSASLKLNVNGNVVTGELKYDRYQKDKNSGMLEGTIKDDLIIADYTFQSEGIVSVREVVFKITDESLLEGFGDIVMKGDTARFKDKTRLSFHGDRPFIKTICN